jgi:transcriptional regulator with XRE-family HTH domain
MEKPNSILKKMLQEKKITQADFARMVEQSPARIGDIIHERVEGNFSYRLLEEWAEMLGYRVEVVYIQK